MRQAKVLQGLTLKSQPHTFVVICSHGVAQLWAVLTVYIGMLMRSQCGRPARPKRPPAGHLQVRVHPAREQRTHPRAGAWWGRPLWSGWPTCGINCLMLRSSINPTATTWVSHIHTYPTHCETSKACLHAGHSLVQSVTPHAGCTSKLRVAHQLIRVCSGCIWVGQTGKAVSTYHGFWDDLVLNVTHTSFDCSQHRRPFHVRVLSLAIWASARTNHRTPEFSLYNVTRRYINLRSRSDT
eukprot:1471470-Pyramimonas_sp.AAC.1